MRKNINDFKMLLIKLQKQRKEDLVNELVDYYNIIKDCHSLSNAIQKERSLKTVKNLAFIIHCTIEGLD